MNKRDWEVYIYGLDTAPEGTKLVNFKAVALCLGYHTEWKTLTGMSASSLTIAKETGLHRNTVNKIIEAMLVAGLVSRREDKRVWSQTGKWTYVYDLHIPDAQIDVHPPMTDAHFEGTDAHFEGTDAQIDVHNHTNNHTKNHTDEPAKAVSKKFDTFQPEKTDSSLVKNVEPSLVEPSLVEKTEVPPVESQPSLVKEVEVPLVETDVSLVSKTNAAEFDIFKLPETCKHGKDTYCRPCDLEDMADLMSLVGAL